MATYVSLLNETEFTGNVNASSITFNGTVDFTDASPIIGLADNISLELITNPITSLIKNILQIKDGGVTNVKIVSMDSNKLTGHITINGSPNIVFDIALDMSNKDILNTGNIIPHGDGIYNIGDFLNRFLVCYGEIGDFSIKVNTPVIDGSLGVELQYNGSTVLKTTLSGMTITGSVIFNSSSVALSGNIYPLFDVNSMCGLSTNRWLTVYTRMIDSSDGVIIKYNNIDRITTTNIGISINGDTDIQNNGISGINTLVGYDELQAYGRNVRINYGSGANESIYIGSTQIKKKKLVIYDAFGDDNRFMGMGLINASQMSFNSPQNFIFYIGTNSITSTEVFRMGTNRLLAGIHLDMNAFSILNAPIINSSTGVNLQYNSSTKLTTTTSGVTITGITDTTTINNTTGVSLQFNGSTKLSTTNTGVIMSGVIDMNNNNITNANTITSQSATALTLTGTTDTNINYATGALNSVFIGGQQIKNKKLVLYNSDAASAHDFYGFGIDFGIFRYQVGKAGDSHVFYVATSATASSEVIRFNGSGISMSRGLNMNLNSIGNVPTLNNPTGINLQYNGATKLNIGLNGITVTGTTDTTTINNSTGVNIQFNSSTKLSTTNTGILMSGIIDMNNNNINNVNAISASTVNSATIVNTGSVKTSGFVGGHRTVTSNTTLAETDYIISVQTSSGQITLTLPLVSGLTYSSGRVWIIKDVSGLAVRNNITINTTSPNLLDGSSKLIINANYSSISIYCNGTNYFIF